MNNESVSATRGVLVEEEIHFSLDELSRACGADVHLLVLLVEEGVLNPANDDPANWRFTGAALPRARKAVRLVRDLDLNTAGTALVLDLLDQIEALRSRLHRLGSQ